MKTILLTMLKIYRFFSKYTPSVCRFNPTCSLYSYQAIEKYGAFKGSSLTVKRVLKCHPWNKGGLDPLQ